MHSSPIGSSQPIKFLHHFATLGGQCTTIVHSWQKCCWPLDFFSFLQQHARQMRFTTSLLLRRVYHACTMYNIYTLLESLIKKLYYSSTLD